MGRVLGVSTSGYYAGCQRPPSRRALEAEKLSQQIAEVHAKSRQTYGVLRVRAELQAQGTCISRRRVARLMRAQGLAGISRRRDQRGTTRRDAQAERPADLVRRQFRASRPDQLWVADITYIPTREGFVYLAMVLDVFSRKIVGWAVSSRQGVELVQEALRLAVLTRGARKVILHSDQGSQYTALAYSEQCLAAGVQQSMGAVGSCYDNAMAESFFATLECELLQRARWANLVEAEEQLCLYLEGFYNRRRRHSALGYCTPVEYEQAWWMQQQDGGQPGRNDQRGTEEGSKSSRRRGLAALPRPHGRGAGMARRAAPQRSLARPEDRYRAGGPEICGTARPIPRPHGAASPRSGVVGAPRH